MFFHTDGTPKSTGNAFDLSFRFTKAPRKAQPRSRTRPKTGAERTAYALATDAEKAAIRLRLWAEAESKILRVNREVDLGAWAPSKSEKAPR